MNETIRNLPTETPPRRSEAITVYDPIPVLDTARFEHMQRIASVMAGSTLIPDCLRLTGDKDNKVELPPAQVLANCFLVVNQAIRWGMDPFAVMQCMSIVHGKPCYEGKLVHAVLESKLGIRLIYNWNNEKNDAFGITVRAEYADGTIVVDGEGKPCEIDGTVGGWKTTASGSPWPKIPKLMLAYRGAREWTRLYRPAILLGVYTNDELEDLSENSRANRAKPIDGPGIAGRLQSSQSNEGFSREHVTREISGETTDNRSQPSTSANNGGAHEVKEMSKVPTEDKDTGAGPTDTGQAGGAPATNSNTEAQRSPEAKASTDASNGDEPSASDEASRSRDAGAASADQGQPPHPSQDDQKSEGGRTTGHLELLTSFSEALGRATQAKSLKAATEDFWKRNEYPMDDLMVKSRVERIHQTHVKRIKGELTVKQAQEEIKEILVS